MPRRPPGELPEPWQVVGLPLGVTEDPIARRGQIRPLNGPRSKRPEDLVERNFAAQRPNQLWVVDCTYVATWAGFVYVAFCFDVFSRMITGWQASRSMTTDLALDALEMGIWQRQRQGHSIHGLVHHSDAGSQAGHNHRD